METPHSTTKSNLSKCSSLTPCRRLGLSRPSPGSLKRCAEVLVNTPDYRKVNELDDTFHQNVESRKKLTIPLKTNNILNKNQLFKCDSLESPQKQQQSSFKRSILNSPIDIKNSNSNNCFQLPLSEQNLSKKDDSIYHVKKKKLSFKSNNDEVLEYNKSIIPSQHKSTGAIDVTAKKQISNNKSEDSSLNEVTPDTIQGLLQTIKEKKKKLELLKVQETYGKKHKLDELQAQSARWRVGGQEALRYSLQLARQAGISITLQQLMAQHGFPPHLMDYNEEYDEFN